MAIAALIVGYILVGVYKAIVTEPKWFQLVGKTRNENTFLSCTKCSVGYIYEERKDHCDSWSLSIPLSGVLWPVGPFFMLAVKRRQKLLRQQRKQEEAKKKREAELKEAEKEIGI
jgi:hypothetical protein